MSLLNINELKVYYFTKRGVVRAVDGVSLSISRGEVLGLVGESGSGKSTLGISLLGLIPPPGRIVGGSIVFDGVELTKLSDDEFAKIRGKRISMIFQDPMTSLNPLMKIGDHLMETIMVHENVPKNEARERSIKALEEVGIPPERFNDYPHQFSGGMRQRVMIALAILLNPDLIIADEPTTALDVIVQAQIIDLLNNLRKRHNMSILLISHDIGVVSEIADKIAVMYAGHLVEMADANKILEDPLHPYTSALLRAVPLIESKSEKLYYIPGSPPDLVKPPRGCRFHPRCPYAKDICRTREPRTVNIKDHIVKCWRYCDAYE